MKNLALILAAVAVLGGCAKVDKPPTPPAYVTLYPGAAQVKIEAVDLWTTESFTSSASQDDVIAFYRAQAKANGIPEDTSVAPSPYAQPNAKDVTFDDPATGRMFKVGAWPVSNAGPLSVVLQWKTPGVTQ
jgi:hypothetical protein